MARPEEPGAQSGQMRLQRFVLSLLFVAVLSTHMTGAKQEAAYVTELGEDDHGTTVHNLDNEPQVKIALNDALRLGTDKAVQKLLQARYTAKKRLQAETSEKPDEPPRRAPSRKAANKKKASKIAKIKKKLSKYTARFEIAGNPQKAERLSHKMSKLRRVLQNYDRKAMIERAKKYFIKAKASETSKTYNSASPSVLKRLKAMNKDVSVKILKLQRKAAERDAENKADRDIQKEKADLKNKELELEKKKVDAQNIDAKLQGALSKLQAKEALALAEQMAMPGKISNAEHAVKSDQKEVVHDERQVGTLESNVERLRKMLTDALRIGEIGRVNAVNQSLAQQEAYLQDSKQNARTATQTVKAAESAVTAAQRLAVVHDKGERSALETQLSMSNLVDELAMKNESSAQNEVRKEQSVRAAIEQEYQLFVEHPLKFREVVTNQGKTCSANETAYVSHNSSKQACAAECALHSDCQYLSISPYDKGETCVACKGLPSKSLRTMLAPGAQLAPSPPVPGVCDWQCYMDRYPALRANGVATQCVRSCKDVRDQDQNAPSGTYNIYSNGAWHKVHCDMATAGGGWTLVYHSNLNLRDADSGPEPVLPNGPNAKLPNGVINSIAQRDINPDQPYDLLLVHNTTDSVVMASTEPFYLHAIDRKVVPVKFDCSQTGAYDSTRVWNVNLGDAKESWIQNWANEDQPGKQHPACKDSGLGMRLQWWFNGKDSMEPDNTDFGVAVPAPFEYPFPVNKFAPALCGASKCPAFSHPGVPQLKEGIVWYCAIRGNSVLLKTYDLSDAVNVLVKTGSYQAIIPMSGANVTVSGVTSLGGDPHSLMIDPLYVKICAPGVPGLFSCTKRDTKLGMAWPGGWSDIQPMRKKCATEVAPAAGSEFTVTHRAKGFANEMWLYVRPGSKAQFGPGTGKEIPCSTTTNSTMVQCMNGTQCNAQCDAQSQACYLDKANCCTNLNCCPPGELAKCPEGYSLCNKENATDFRGKCVLGPKCPRAEYGNKKCYDGNPDERWSIHVGGRGHTCNETLTGNGADYRGCQTKTRSGHTCQQWFKQTPHKHSHSGKLGDQSNYCRNPDGEPSIWCYTTNGTKRWDFCDPTSVSSPNDDSISNDLTSNVSSSRCQSELPANVSLPGTQNCCPNGMTPRDDDGVGCEGEINGANRTCAIYDMGPTQDRCFLTSMNATDPAKQTHPCVLAEFIASLSPGDGYYFNPTIIGGWCTRIDAADVAATRAAVGSTSWYSNDKYHGKTFLPPVRASIGNPAGASLSSCTNAQTHWKDFGKAQGLDCTCPSSAITLKREYGGYQFIKASYVKPPGSLAISESFNPKYSPTVTNVQFQTKAGLWINGTKNLVESSFLERFPALGPWEDKCCDSSACCRTLNQATGGWRLGNISGTQDQDAYWSFAQPQQIVGLRGFTPYAAMTYPCGLNCVKKVPETALWHLYGKASPHSEWESIGVRLATSTGCGMTNFPLLSSIGDWRRIPETKMCRADLHQAHSFDMCRATCRSRRYMHYSPGDHKCSCCTTIPVAPGTIPLLNLGGSGCTASKPCEACQGDCDRDTDCKSGLKCFQRSGYDQVPGCAAGPPGPSGYDYCQMDTTQLVGSGMWENAMVGPPGEFTSEELTMQTKHRNQFLPPPPASFAESPGWCRNYTEGNDLGHGPGMAYWDNTQATVLNDVRMVLAAEKTYCAKMPRVHHRGSYINLISRKPEHQGRSKSLKEPTKATFIAVTIDECSRACLINHKCNFMLFVPYSGACVGLAECDPVKVTPEWRMDSLQNQTVSPTENPMEGRNSPPDLYAKTVPSANEKRAYPSAEALDPDYSCAACNASAWKAVAGKQLPAGEGFCTNQDGSPSPVIKAMNNAELGILRDECAKTAGCSHVQYTCGWCRTGFAFGLLLSSCDKIDPSAGIEAFAYIGKSQGDRRRRTTQAQPRTYDQAPKEVLGAGCGGASHRYIEGTLLHDMDDIANQHFYESSWYPNSPNVHTSIDQAPETAFRPQTGQTWREHMGSNPGRVYGTTEDAKNAYCCYMCQLATKCEFWVRNSTSCHLMKDLKKSTPSKQHFSGIKMNTMDQTKCTNLCATHAGCSQAVFEQKRPLPKPKARISARAAPLMSGISHGFLSQAQGYCSMSDVALGNSTSPQACMDKAVLEGSCRAPNGEVIIQFDKPGVWNPRPTQGLSDSAAYAYAVVAPKTNCRCCNATDIRGKSEMSPIKAGQHFRSYGSQYRFAAGAGSAFTRHGHYKLNENGDVYSGWWTNAVPEQVVPSRCWLSKGTTPSSNQGLDTCTFGNCSSRCLSRSYSELQEYTAVNATRVSELRRELVNAKSVVRTAQADLMSNKSMVNKTKASEKELVSEITTVGMSINASSSTDEAKARLKVKIAKEKEAEEATEKVAQEERAAIEEEKKDIIRKEEQASAEAATTKIVAKEAIIKKSVDKVSEKANSQTTAAAVKSKWLLKILHRIAAAVVDLKIDAKFVTTTRQKLTSITKEQDKLLLNISNLAAQILVSNVAEEKDIFKDEMRVSQSKADKLEARFARLTNAADEMQTKTTTDIDAKRKHLQFVMANLLSLKTGAFEASTLEEYRETLDQVKLIEPVARKVKQELADVVDSMKVDSEPVGNNAKAASAKTQAMVENALHMVNDDDSTSQAVSQLLVKTQQDLKRAEKAEAEPLTIVHEQKLQPQLAARSKEEAQEGSVQTAKTKAKLLKNAELKESEAKTKGAAKLASQKVDLESLLVKLKTRTRDVAMANTKAKAMKQELAKTNNAGNAEEIRGAIKAEREKAANLYAQVETMIPKLANIKAAMKTAQIQGQAERVHETERIQEAQNEFNQAAQTAKSATSKLVNKEEMKESAASSQAEAAESQEKQAEQSADIASLRLDNLKKQALAPDAAADSTRQAQIQAEVSAEEQKLDKLEEKKELAKADVVAAQKAKAEADVQKPRVQAAENNEARVIDQHAIDQAQVKGQQEAAARAKAQEIKTEIDQSSDPDKVEELSKDLANVEAEASLSDHSRKAALAAENSAEPTETTQSTAPDAQSEAPTKTEYKAALTKEMEEAGLAFKDKGRWITDQAQKLARKDTISSAGAAQVTTARRQTIAAAVLPYKEQLTDLRQQQAKLKSQLDPHSNTN